MEKACLLVDYLNISQKANSSYSHKGDLAIDISGKDRNISILKAPFTGIIKRIYPSNNTVWLESIDKVMYADGTVDYMTVMTMHDNDVSNLSIGKVINQGQHYYDEGNKGNATGNHIHIAVGKGKYSGNGWYKNEYGVWCINNQYPIYKALYLLNTINIINDGGYDWIKINNINVDNSVKFHIVKKGDNLTKISKKYNTTIGKIAKLNNIVNINLIYVGQKILIPSNNIEYYKKYTGNSVSIQDALDSINEKGTYTNRIKIAKMNGILNYVGTSKQNTHLLNLLKEGKLIKSKD